MNFLSRTTKVKFTLGECIALKNALTLAKAKTDENGIDYEYDIHEVDLPILTDVIAKATEYFEAEQKKGTRATKEVKLTLGQLGIILNALELEKDFENARFGKASLRSLKRLEKKLNTATINIVYRRKWFAHNDYLLVDLRDFFAGANKAIRDKVAHVLEDAEDYNYLTESLD